MTRHTTKILAAVAAVAAIGAGSAALANASGHRAKSSARPDQGDQVQQQRSGADTEHGETAREGAGEHGSEVPAGDGPGGHADEPANPNADHEAQGAE